MTEPTSYPPVDQTQFMTEEPLYEKRMPRPADPAPNQLDLAAPRPKNPLKIAVMGAVGVVGLLILLAAVVTVMPQAKKDVPVTEQPNSAQEVMSGPFQQKINDLRAELKASDPSAESLPFPPVDMNITIQEE